MLLRRASGPVVAVSLAACASIFGFEELHDRGAADASAGPDAAGPSDGTAAECPKLTVPEAPADDPDPTGGGERVFTLNALDVFPKDGLNLDGVCTTRDNPNASCILPAGSAPDDSRYWLDQPNGVDQSGNVLLRDVANLFPVLDPSQLESSVRYGYVNVLVRVTGWNGQPDDRNVLVSVYLSRGLESPTQAGRIERRLPNEADPSERWVHSHEAATSGYVRDGRLVAHFRTPVAVMLPSQLGSAPDAGGLAPDAHAFFVTLDNTYLLADLTDRGLQNGLLSGRVQFEAFLAAIGRLYRNTNDPVCRNPPALVTTALARLCFTRDVRGGSDPSDDGTLPCNAISMAFGFTSRLAALGNEDMEADVDPCPADYHPGDCDGPPPTDLDAGPDAEAGDAGAEAGDAGDAGL